MACCSAQRWGRWCSRFIFWYPFLRFFLDLFRDYPTHRLALGTGQTLNIVMMLLGAVLLYRSRLRRLGRLEARRGLQAVEPVRQQAESWTRRVAFGVVIVISLTIAHRPSPIAYGPSPTAQRHRSSPL